MPAPVVATWLSKWINWNSTVVWLWGESFLNGCEWTMVTPFTTCEWVKSVIPAMYDINSTGRNHLIIFRYPCFIRLVLWQRYKVFHNGTIPIYGDNKYSHYLSLQSASSSVSSISIRQKACKNQSVPPWRKFCSAMVEQNFLHGGTECSPRWNE